jgi:hypothetical protein
MDLGIPAAPIWWCWVADGRAVETGPSLFLEGLTRLARTHATPLDRLPTASLRVALAAALGARQRLRAALLRPFVHPSATAAAKLLRAMEASGIRASAAAAARLRRPLGPALARYVDEALARGERVEQILGSLAAGDPAEELEVRDVIEVVGFVSFVVRS